MLMMLKVEVSQWQVHQSLGKDQNSNLMVFPFQCSAHRLTNLIWNHARVPIQSLKRARKDIMKAIL